MTKNRYLKKTGFITVLTCLLVAALFIIYSFSDKNKVYIEPSIKDLKPNIVIVMADDLDSGQLSCYGGQNINTTHIDELADEGMKFNNIICSEAMCVPTRASLFTGLYPMRHGAFQNHKKVYDSVPIKSVGHYLGDLGYRVALTGKNDCTRPKSIYPFEIIDGFETSCVSLTDDYSLAGIRNLVKTSKDPFCLFVMSINPHAPWTMGDPSEFDAKSLKLPPNYVDTPETRADYTKYLAEVRRLDNQVGDVVQMLKDTGQYDNTIVIFLGEQGPKFPGGKWTLWDQGQKSSMIVKWNKTVKPGTSTNAIVQYEDIVPTLIDIAGGKPVADLDGKTFLDVLKDTSDSHRDFAYGIHNNIPEGPAYPVRGIRSARYKLIENLTPEAKFHIKYTMNPNDKGDVWASWVEQGKTSSEAKSLTQRIVNRPPMEFYDLKNDPYELKNLAQNADYADMVQEYDIKLKQWMKEQGDPGASIDKHYK